MKIIHSVEGGDVEQVCTNLETILPCLQLLISLFLSLVFYILHVLIVLISYMFDIHLCLIDIHDWFVCMLTLVFNHESHSVTSTLNIEESLGDSTESFTENSATLLCYTLCVSLIVFSLHN